MKRRTEQKIYYVVSVICILFVLWFLMSFIDVNMSNLTDCQYEPWNLFVAFTELGGK